MRHLLTIKSPSRQRRFPLLQDVKEVTCELDAVLLHAAAAGPAELADVLVSGLPASTAGTL